MSRTIMIVPADQYVDRLYQLYTGLDDLDRAEGFEHYVGKAVAACRTYPPTRIDVNRLVEDLGDLEYMDKNSTAMVFAVGLEQFTAQIYDLFVYYDMYDTERRRLRYRFERLTAGDIIMASNESIRAPISVLELERDDYHPRV